MTELERFKQRFCELLDAELKKNDGKGELYNEEHIVQTLLNEFPNADDLAAQIDPLEIIEPRLLKLSLS